MREKDGGENSGIPILSRKNKTSLNIVTFPTSRRRVLPVEKKSSEIYDDGISDKVDGHGLYQLSKSVNPCTNLVKLEVLRSNSFKSSR
ncbi:hypothetical protein SUGI_0477630 [Cryptomeria japonica]|nr:hypothetical protein SUGI_0477630 [Cryptomeria japonica]